MPGFTRPKKTSRATIASAAGKAAARTRSSVSGARHHGASVGAVPVVSILNGALITLTESPRSCLKPMLSLTSAVSLSSSSLVSGTAVFLPLASIVWPLLTTTAALTRLTVPLALRVTRTVLSTS
jgi:hypothetical protein